MKKTIILKGKYTVRVYLELETDYDNKPRFSCSADCYRLGMHGQCLDALNPYMENNTLWNMIYRLWKNHHLNHLHAGTKKQEQKLEEVFGDLRVDYKDKRDCLSEYGLLEDDGHKYGHGWVYWEIPADDLAIMKAIIVDK